MDQLVGREATIRKSDHDEHGFYYELNEFDYTFDESWLEPIELFSDESDDKLEDIDLSFWISEFKVTGDGQSEGC